jgi:hypothetical protein
MILVATDTDGLVLAARELFKHSLGDKKLEQMLKDSELDQAQIAKLVPQLRLSPGYYDQVQYLLWLKQMLDAGIPLGEISAEEADGIVAVKRAWQEFDEEFPPCADCGVRNDRGTRHLCPERQRRKAGGR